MIERSGAPQDRRDRGSVLKIKPDKGEWSSQGGVMMMSLLSVQIGLMVIEIRREEEGDDDGDGESSVAEIS